MSSFGALSTALQGLRAQRFGLDTTGQNVSNANTAGYTRQRVELTAVNAMRTPALFARADGPGGGVEVTGVARLSDALADARLRGERASAAYLQATEGVWRRVDVALAEPTDEGLSARLSDLHAAFHDLANEPGQPATRVQVLQAGRAVTDTLATLAGEVAQEWDDQRTQLATLADEVSAAAEQVASLNDEIRRSTVDGGSPNELADTRDALVLRLTELTGATVRAGDLGTVDVLVGGHALVRGTEAASLGVAAGSAASLEDVLATGTVSLAVTGSAGTFAADVPGGEIGAVLTVLDETLPGVRGRLDDAASALATEVNAQHAAGAGLDAVTGRDFFTGTTAADLAVAITDPDQVAAAAAGAGALDGSNADALGALGEAPDGAVATWRDVVADLGASAQAATRRSATQEVVVRAAEQARESAAGVDLDEELTNMVMYQRGYEAAARVMTAVDEALATLVNRTGIVGR